MTVEFNNVSRGFCYDEKTEVLTKEGWKFFKDTDDNDLFLTLNIKTKKVEYQKRVGVTIEPWDGELICGRSTMVDFAVTPNHRMVYFPYDKRVNKIWTIAKAEEIYGKRVKFLRGLFDKWEGRQIKEEYPQQSSLAFAKFLGIFITDGSLYKGKESGGRISIAQTKKEGRRFIRKVLDKLNWNYIENKAEFRINDTKLYNFLRKYFPEGQKKSIKGRVPDWIRMAPKEYIEAFIEGVITGDGNIHKKNGHKVIYTGSKKMADDYQECVLKMGLCSSIRIDNRKGLKRRVLGNIIENKRKTYIVSITERTNVHLFNKKHWFKKHYKGNVYCVTIPNGTLYVRRNGKAFWSGNTHELVRHRLASYTQESTRYVDESNFRVVIPPDKDPNEKLVELNLSGGIKIKVSFQEWMDLNEQMYRGLRKIGWVPQDARQVLPIGVKSQIVMTANFREWRHVFKLRKSPNAHWEIRRVMTNLLEDVKPRVPVIFDDL
jgi:intein/homing endonuclease